MVLAVSTSLIYSRCLPCRRICLTGAASEFEKTFLRSYTNAEYSVQSAKNDSYTHSGVVCSATSGHGGGSGGNWGSGGHGGNGGPEDGSEGHRSASFLTALLALLMIVGGGMGWVRKGSKTSLIAGATIGSLLLVSAKLMIAPSAGSIGFKMAFGLCVCTAVAMGNRSLKTGAFTAGKVGPTTAVFGLSSACALSYFVFFRSMLF